VPLDLRCPRAEAVPSGGCECTPRIEGSTSARRPINTGDVRPCGNTAGGPPRTRQPAKPSKHGVLSDSCSEPEKERIDDLSKRAAQLSQRADNLQALLAAESTTTHEHVKLVDAKLLLLDAKAGPRSV